MKQISHYSSESYPGKVNLNLMIKGKWNLLCEREPEEFGLFSLANHRPRDNPFAV